MVRARSGAAAKPARALARAPAPPASGRWSTASVGSSAKAPVRETMQQVPAAKARASEPELSPLEGKRRFTSASAAATCASNSSAGRWPVTRARAPRRPARPGGTSPAWIQRRSGSPSSAASTQSRRLAAEAKPAVTTRNSSAPMPSPARAAARLGRVPGSRRCGMTSTCAVAASPCVRRSRFRAKREWTMTACERASTSPARSKSRWLARVEKPCSRRCRA